MKSKRDHLRTDRLATTKVVRKWSELNSDCLTNIFERAGMEALIFFLPLVCKSWYKVSRSPLCWKTLDFKSPSWSRVENTFRGIVPVPKLIKLGIHRSKGMATSVVLPVHWTWGWDLKDIMTSLAEGCPGLKVLILFNSVNAQELNCVLELIHKWKDLEVLGIRGGCKEVVTQIGTHCKNFVGFATIGIIGPEEASAIGNFLPNIKCLTLSGSDLPRESLILILSNCRELQMLNVRYCVGFDADDAEILQMASHIKTFRSEGSILCEYDDYYLPGEGDDVELFFHIYFNFHLLCTEQF